MEFTRSNFTGFENRGFVVIFLVLNGTSANPFSVNVTPSEQSPVSAKGNNVMSIIICIE